MNENLGQNPIPSPQRTDEEEKSREELLEGLQSLELSEQEREKVLDKMCDITTPGIGYTAFRNYKNFLNKIFRNGILGGIREDWDDDDPYTYTKKIESVRDWAKQAREAQRKGEREARVFFNITGRAFYERANGYTAGWGDWIQNVEGRKSDGVPLSGRQFMYPEMRYYLENESSMHKYDHAGMRWLFKKERNNNFFIIFDPSKFKEAGLGYSSKIGTFTKTTETGCLHGNYDHIGYGFESKEEWKDFQKKAFGIYGFNLAARVSPKLFKGVIMVERPVKEIEFTRQTTLEERKDKFLEMFLSDAESELRYLQEINSYEKNSVPVDYSQRKEREIKLILEHLTKLASSFVDIFIKMMLSEKKCQNYQDVESFSDEEKRFLFDFIRKRIKFPTETDKYNLYEGSNPLYDIKLAELRDIIYSLPNYISEIFLNINGSYYMQEKDPEKVRLFKESKAEELAREMISGVSDKRDRIVPIYDLDGNMVWPEWKTHKQIVEELEETKNDKN